ncbi:MAG: bile acid:sodium symporter family protein [Opitutaceae bacterium]|nr:bile acid:sodium symporter family protein [Opitutaceae bacterium]
MAVVPIALILLLAGLGLRRADLWQPASVALGVSLAIGIGAIPALRGYQFTAWIITTVVAGMTYPAELLHWGDFDLRNKWVILIAIQTVMFGMGTQMSIRDFTGVLKMPWGVGVAVVSQFTIMPLVGWSLTKAFHFPDEIAAGVILVGCCSSGLASNVMCYIAKANIALSITATACTTMLAPLMTPLWMKLLAGTLVEVSVLKMMTDIVKIVIVPIGATLLHDYLKFASPRPRRIIHGLAVAAAAWIAFLILGGWSLLFAGTSAGTQLAVELAAFLLGAITGGVVYHRLTRLLPRLDQWMPVASMVGIMYFTTVSTAAGRDNLLQVGALLFLVAAIHNAAGYGLGYLFGRAAGLDKNSARTIAIEVGLQNGGMASGIAGSMGKLATLGLGGAVFGSWMNISGSILANYWKRKPVDD